jgi:hypothetical protein
MCCALAEVAKSKQKLCTEFGISRDAASHSDMDFFALDTPTTCSLGVPHVSEKWGAKIGQEVRDFLRLAYVEKATIQSEEAVLKVERALAIDKCISQRMLRDSLHASLIEESCN